jgi:hypothetical protein
MADTELCGWTDVENADLLMTFLEEVLQILRLV